MVRINSKSLAGLFAGLAIAGTAQPQERHKVDALYSMVTVQAAFISVFSKNAKIDGDRLYTWSKAMDTGVTHMTVFDFNTKVICDTSDATRPAGAKLCPAESNRAFAELHDIDQKRIKEFACRVAGQKDASKDIPAFVQFAPANPGFLGKHCK